MDGLWIWFALTFILIAWLLARRAIRSSKLLSNETFSIKPLLTGFVAALFLVLAVWSYGSPSGVAKITYRFDMLTNIRKLYYCGDSNKYKGATEVTFLASELNVKITFIGDCPRTSWGQGYMKAYNDMAWKRLHSYDASDPGWNPN
jgi:hypothetical protein